MRKIVAGLFVSLDGVFEAPDQWHFPYFDEEMGQAVQAQMEQSDAMLLGRKTYQEFASYWPKQGSDVELADHMNGMPKYVVSNTLTSLDWQNSTLISGDVRGTLTALKSQPGKALGITGSGTLVRSLLRDGLLDELHLLVHPIVVEKGMRLFDGQGDRVPLTLAASKTFGSGVLYLTYTPAPAPAAG
jgi:dihydrofolate reductase